MIIRDLRHERLLVDLISATQTAESMLLEPGVGPSEHAFLQSAHQKLQLAQLEIEMARRCAERGEDA